MTENAQQAAPGEDGARLRAHAKTARRGERPALRPLWRDHLRIGLGPASIAFAQYRRGLRAALAETAVIALPSPSGCTPWQAAVDALHEALPRLLRGRPNVTVVLSNHFVRYALLPWSAALKNDADWRALARHRFSSVHGAAAETWIIRLAGTHRQGPRIASAMDRALLLALEEKIGAHGSLVSVQPCLAAVYNRLQPIMGHESCWLVIEEPGRLTLSLFDRGAWHALRTRRRDESSRSTLQDILDRESALLALKEPCTRVALCSHAPRDDDMRGPYEIRDLTFSGNSAVRERELALALE